MYKEALDLIHNSRYILIITHINPDADTISCALALSNYLYENNLKHKVFNKQNDLPKNLDFLPRFDKITDQLPKFYDLVIYVDCANKTRTAIEIDNTINSINIDHHQSNENFATINIVNSDKSSAAEVVYDFFDINNIQISKNTASCLYVGIYDDSVKFSTPRCDKDTFKTVSNLVNLGVEPNYIADNLNRRESLAKYRLLPLVLQSLQLYFEGKVGIIYVLPKWLEETGASYKECEGMVNMILNIGIIKLAIFLRVSNGQTRVSLRSKHNVDVTVIAKYFNGGGHLAAAGCNCETTDIFEAKEQILNYIKGLDGYL